MQIAIVIPDEQVDELDRLVPEQFSSRAEVVRTAVEAWLAERRTTAIDRRYQAAYDGSPSDVDDIDSGRMGKGEPLSPGIWDDLDW